MTYEYQMGYWPPQSSPAPTRVIEVYGTMPEAQEYIQEEFNLPAPPPPYALQPPINPRTDPYRRVTYLPIDAMGSDTANPSFFERNKSWLVPAGIIAGGYLLGRALGLFGSRSLLANPPIRDVKYQEAGPTGYIPTKRGEARPYDPAKLRPPGRYRTVKSYVDACLEINPDALKIKNLPARLPAFRSRDAERKRQEAIKATAKAYREILAVGRGTFAPEDWVGKPGLYFRLRDLAMLSAGFIVTHQTQKIKLVGVAMSDTALRLWLYLGMPSIDRLTEKSKDTIRDAMRDRKKSPTGRPRMRGYNVAGRERRVTDFSKSISTPGTKNSAAWKLVQIFDTHFKEDSPDLVTPRLVWQILNIKGSFRLKLNSLEETLKALQATPVKDQWRIRWYVEHKIKDTWNRTPRNQRRALMDEGVFVNLHPSIVSEIMEMPEKAFVREYPPFSSRGETTWARLYNRVPKVDALRKAQPAEVASIPRKALVKIMQSKELADYRQEELDEIAENHIKKLVEQIEKDQELLEKYDEDLDIADERIEDEKNRINELKKSRKATLTRIKELERKKEADGKLYYFDESRLETLRDSYKGSFHAMQEARTRADRFEREKKRRKRSIVRRRAHVARMIKVLERVKREGVKEKAVLDQADGSKVSVAIPLSVVFGQGWKSWIDKMESRGINLHDATYWLPTVASPGLDIYLQKHWDDKIPRLTKIAKAWNTLTPRQKTLSPKNIEIEIDAKAYVKTAEIRDLALEASKWAILEEHYPAIENRFGKALEAWRSGMLEDQMPELEYSLDGYRIFKVDREDPRGLFAGEHTLCCQHPHPKAEGRHCAWHGVESPLGAIYAVEDPEGTIIAQSWAWRNGDFMVMDNIEEVIFNRASGYTRGIAKEEAIKKGITKRADQGSYIEKREPQIQKHLINIVFSLYQALADDIVQHRAKGIVEVRVGWGSTPFDAPKTWVFDNEVIVPLPEDYPEGYSDSRLTQYIIASVHPNSLETFSALRKGDDS